MAERIVFTGKGELHFETFEPEAVGAGQVGIQTVCSLMSTGTENIVLNRMFEEGSHWDDWVEYPFYPGYANIARVNKVGEGVEGIKAGDLVATRLGHASYHVTTPDQCCPVPADLDPRQAVWFALAKIAYHGALVAQYALGADVLIIGAGPIGQMSVRWARAAGAEAIIVADMVDQRLEMAKRGGATTVIAKGVEEAEAEIKKANNGKQPSLVMDTTGNYKVFLSAMKVAAEFGRVILLGDTGTPSKQHLSPDLIEKGLCVAGAHDIHENEKWNLGTITRLFYNMVVSGRFNVEGLNTHIFAPADCEKAYATANTKRAETMGIVFDWSK